MNIRDGLLEAAEKTGFPNRFEITESLMEHQFLWNHCFFFHENGWRVVVITLSGVDDSLMKHIAESWGAESIEVEGTLLKAWF